MTDELLLTLNEWLDALGIDWGLGLHKTYRKDMNDAYQKDIPVLKYQIAKVLKRDRPNREKIANAISECRIENIGCDGLAQHILNRVLIPDEKETRKAERERIINKLIEVRKTCLKSEGDIVTSIIQSLKGEV